LKGNAMTDAELAILTLLNDGIQTDHALHAEIDSRGLRRWTAIGVSSMYYILEKLVKQGLVEAIHDHRPERAWRITQAGAGVLQTAIADLLSTPHTAQRGIEMGLANLHVLRPTQIHTALENYRHELTVRLTHAQAEIATEQKGTAKFATLAMY
jgi:DNA-binding PadR family transcriptional regulator